MSSFVKVSLTYTRQLNSCHVNLHDIHGFHLRPDLSWRNQTEPDFQSQTSMMWCQYVSQLYVSVAGSWHQSMMLILLHICLYFASTFAEEKQRPPNVLFIVADDLGKYYYFVCRYVYRKWRRSQFCAKSLFHKMAQVSSCARALITGELKLSNILIFC